jgi:general secretion pathway protein N
MRRTVAASAALIAVVSLLADLAIVPSRGSRDADSAQPPKSAELPRALKPVGAYAAVAERPLFQPSRRPAPPPAPKAAPPIAEAVATQTAPPATTPAPPPVLAPMTLLAIVISDNKREAVLGLAGGKSSTLAEGETLDGWTLASVLPDRVVFRLAATEKEVTFPVGQATARPAPSKIAKNPTPPTQRPH